MVQEVHDEALDVGAIVVLIRHDHQVPIAQLLCAVVHLSSNAFIVTAQPMKQSPACTWHVEHLPCAADSWADGSNACVLARAA